MPNKKTYTVGSYFRERLTVEGKVEATDFVKLLIINHMMIIVDKCNSAHVVTPCLELVLDEYSISC